VPLFVILLAITLAGVIPVKAIPIKAILVRAIPVKLVLLLPNSSSFSALRSSFNI
jgi:hypothetical protein